MKVIGGEEKIKTEETKMKETQRTKKESLERLACSSHGVHIVFQIDYHEMRVQKSSEREKERIKINFKMTSK
jgi:hypothetical protein